MVDRLCRDPMPDSPAGRAQWSTGASLRVADAKSCRGGHEPVFSHGLHGDGTVWGLRSATFDQLQSAEEVRAQAIILTARLNGALRAQWALLHGY